MVSAVIPRSKSDRRPTQRPAGHARVQVARSKADTHDVTRQRLTAATRAARRALFVALAFTWAVPIGVSVFVFAAAIGLFVVAPNLLYVWLFVTFPLAAKAGALLARCPIGEVSLVGHPVSEPDEPELWEAVKDGASVARISAPTNVIVSASPEVQARALNDEFVIALGLPWLTATARHELTASVVLALGEVEAGVGSHAERRLHARLDHIGDVLSVRKRPGVWRWYLRRAMQLSDRAVRLRERAADAACVAALGHEGLFAARRARARHRDFDVYWHDDVGPCLQEGFAPPILDGWHALVDDEDGHGDAGIAWAPTRSLERAVLEAELPDGASTLVDIEWSRVGAAVWAPRLRRQFASRGHAPAPFPIIQLADAVREDDEFDVAGAMFLALVDHAGWDLEKRPGTPLRVVQNGATIDPVAVSYEALLPTWDAEAWGEFLRSVGLEDFIVDVTAELSESAQSLPLPTGVSEKCSVQLELAPLPHRRKAAVFLAVSAALSALAALGFMLASSAAPTNAGRLIFVATGIVLSSALALLLRHRIRILRARPTLVLHGDTVTVHHPGVLKRDFAIPRESVRAVLFDDGLHSAIRRFPVDPELTLSAGLPQHAAWLWSPETVTLVPLLGTGGETPNLAILVVDPTLAPAVRRVTLTGPIPGEALSGLLFEVTDVAAAREAFEPWQLSRTLARGDAAEVVATCLGPEDAHSSSG